MWTVWFTNKYGDDCIFVSLPDYALADAVAGALTEEGFVQHAWVEKD